MNNHSDQSSNGKEKLIRYALAFILFVIALNALGGGYYAMAGAKDVPIEWLEKSPFSNYFIPGLFLFVVIGGTCLFTSIAVLMRKPKARTLSFICSALLLIWILIQVRIIGYVSWMQPAVVIGGVLIFLLAWFLPKSQEQGARGI